MDFSEDQFSSKLDTFFITGATGLMGSEFLYEVLKKSSSAECILLIRADTEKKLVSRLDALLKYLFQKEGLVEEMSKRVTAVAGDVASDNLGLNEADWTKVTERSNYILHAAALTDWGANIEDATKVNVTGVEAVIRLAHSCGNKLKKMMHISTAYISGVRTGEILPSEENVVENACDNYQISKIKGEALVKAEFGNLPITIVRPVAVVGNSLNGRTPTYKTFYYPLQMLYNGLPMILPVNRQGNLEAIPSDWAAKVMIEMMLDNTTNSKCYHLSNGDKVLTNSEVKNVVYKVFRDIGEKPNKTYYLPYWVYDKLGSKIIKMKVPGGEGLDEKLRLYRHYMTYKRIFNNTSTKDFSLDKGIFLPEFKDYLPVLVKYAIENKWRRKRDILSKRLNRKKDF